MAEWLTPRTLDLEVQGSSLARCVVSIEKILYSLFAHVYKWIPASYCEVGGGEGLGLGLVGNPRLASHPGGSSNTPRHASCYGNRYTCKPQPCGPLAGVCLYLCCSSSNLNFLCI